MRNSETISAAARTAGVIFGGVVLSFLLVVGLMWVLAPDTPKLVAYQLGLLPPPTTHAEIADLTHRIRVNWIVTRYIIGPLMGIGVGLFVGLLQRSRPGLTAAICVLPETWKTAVSVVFYRVPVVERVEVIGRNLLPICCSILVAVAIWRIRNRRKPRMARVMVPET